MRQRAVLNVVAGLLFVLLSAVLSHTIFAAEDCCTPEATAKIAAKAGFVDVVGIKLGMPVKDAIAALKQHNDKLQVIHRPAIGIGRVPDVAFSDGLDARTSDGSEEIQLSVAMPPNQELVWSVIRDITYAGDNRPAVANVLTALRQKYGPEDGSFQNPMIAKMNGVELIDAYWVFDVNGKKVPAKQAKAYGEYCRSIDSAGQDATGVLQPSRPAAWTGNNGTSCGEWTMVVANWQPTMPAARQPPGLALNLRVQAVNGLLHRSAYETSAAMVQQADRNRANQEQQKGKQVKPVL